MRQITFQVYHFNELSEKAKEKAIESYKDHIMETQSDMALDWAIDDCALFEPPHAEMTAILGEGYYEENACKDGYGQFVFKNLRKGLGFDLDRRSLDYAQALEITNRRMFLLWLGIPEHLHDIVDYEIENGPRGTQLQMEIVDWDQEELTTEVSPLLEAAEKKFWAHNERILDSIQSSYDYYFSDEKIKEDLEANEIEFLEEGTQYNGRR